MEKSKLLTIAIIGLLLINIATLGFLFMNKPKSGMYEMGNNRPTPKEIITLKLQFNDAQKEEYEILIEKHRENIRQTEDQIRNVKNELYSNLSDESKQSSNESLVNQLANLQKQIENTHLEHFQDIKKLCRENQLDDYNQLTKELSRFFNNAHEPHGPPR
jgi:periplasmic protein CpxP/Spy